MAIRQCKECGGKVSDSARACPHCGSKSNESMRAQLNRIGGNLILTFVVLFIIVLFLLK